MSATLQKRLDTLGVCRAFNIPPDVASPRETKDYQNGLTQRCSIATQGTIGNKGGSRTRFGGAMRPTTEELLAFLQSKKADFHQEFKIRKIGVFGSCARGTATDTSDIDIVVELEKPDLYYLIGIKQAIEEIFGSKVDVVRLRPQMNSLLKKRIEQDVIYV